MRRRIMITLACVAAPVGGLAAQDNVSAPAGTRVRVTGSEVRARPVTGTVVGWHADTLVLLLQEGGESLRVPAAALARLEVSRGRRSNAGRGARLGLLGGAVVGAGLGAAFADAQVVSNGTMVALAAGFGSVTGMLLGAGIGAAIHSERWEDVPLPDVALVLAPPGAGGLTLRISVSF